MAGSRHQKSKAHFGATKTRRAITPPLNTHGPFRTPRAPGARQRRRRERLQASTVAAKHDLLPTVLQRVATSMCLPDDDVAALSPALRRKVGQMLSAREFERYRRAALDTRLEH